jgi:hypothetical protein
MNNSSHTVLSPFTRINITDRNAQKRSKAQSKRSIKKGEEHLSRNAKVERADEVLVLLEDKKIYGSPHPTMYTTRSSPPPFFFPKKNYKSSTHTTTHLVLDLAFPTFDEDTPPPQGSTIGFKLRGTRKRLCLSRRDSLPPNSIESRSDDYHNRHDNEEDKEECHDILKSK